MPSFKGFERRTQPKSVLQKTYDKVNQLLSPYFFWAPEYTVEQFVKYLDMTDDQLAYELERLKQMLDAGFTDKQGGVFVETIQNLYAIQAFLAGRLQK